MKTFELEIITPGNTIFNGMVSSLIIPAYEGYMGIMAGHASFIGSLGIGKISFSRSANPDVTSEQSDESTDAYFVKDGFVEVISHPFSTTKVTILAENIKITTGLN